MYIVTFAHQGKTYYLRNTVPTEQLARASRYSTDAAARAAIESAAKFNRPALIKTATVTPA